MHPMTIIDYNRFMPQQNGNISSLHTSPKKTPSRSETRIHLVLIGLLMCLLLACQSSQVDKILNSFESTPTPTVTSTYTPVPTFTPTLEPSITPTAEPDDLGSETNPLVISFVSEKMDPASKSAADQIALTISEASGLSIISELSPSYEWTLKGMSEKAVHLAWLPPLTYLYASQIGVADALLLAEQFGVYSYGIQFLANPINKFKVYYDSEKNKSTADAAAALLQFKSKKPCWVDSTSASGYVYPFGLLKANKVDPPDGIFMNSHTAVIRSLYIGGICDYGVTYAISGDPRTASDIQKDLPNVMDKVVIIWASEEVIPNLNLAVDPSIPPKMREILSTALIEYCAGQEGLTMLATANSYKIDNLLPVSNREYDALLLAVQSSGIDLTTTIGN
jgi:phosphonate transport system substrate-binding protein